MDAERWKKIEEIFQSALDLETSERAEFIRAESGGDDELRAEIEKLVARYEVEEDFLESPVWTDSAVLGNTLKNRVAESLEEILPSPAEKSFSGRKIGVYLLTEQIGRGGMGVVYAAERVDGEFSQKVAVKLIKRGMDTDFIVRRFRHERQILASLNHPNIARLLDGGTTADDSPYFIMEFIEGEPFLKYCEKKNLDLRQKLELFLQVCAAIAYAHKRKIIHRDIKPSNILVTGDGVPKLLDFGIAKILEADSIHESLMPTATAMRLMTPEYASPEQVRGEQITPATDQYSLGVLLYELITGMRPYKFPSRAPHEIARVICEEIPNEPSSGSFEKISTDNSDFRFDKDFCKNLDRVVLKTLRKNPLERYVSVDEFSADIERFLRNKKVLAESFTNESELIEVPPTTAENVPNTSETEKTAKEALRDDPAIASQTNETAISARRKGVKQGLFITILSVILIPFFLIITVTAIIPPPLTVAIFLLSFFGGLVRILYALLFEDGKTISPETEIKKISEAETTIINAGAPRETIAGKQTTAEKTAEGKKSIAVLPFKNFNTASGETTGDSEFLSVGLADALITRLSNVKQLLVRPTSSVLRFSAENSEAFAAGEQLKVEYLLTGNIVRAQSKIRVSIQLLDVEKRATVWAERFDEDLTDVLELEDSISAKVAALLLPTLTGEERKQIEKRGTNNSDAHEAYLRGRFYWNSFTEEGFRQAKFYYEKAIEIDPNYALAYAGLTDYYLWLGAYAMLPPKDCFPLARKAAEKAVALDNESAEAHSALGFAQLCDGYDWKQSEKSALRAIELNPNYISTYIWYSSHYLGREKYVEALDLLRHAIKLDPLSYQSHNSMAYGLYFARRFDEAIAKAEENIKIFPVFSLPYNALSHFLNYVGRSEESLKITDRAMELSTNLDRIPTLFERSFALAAAGKRAEASKLLGEIGSQAGEKHISPREHIIAYSYLGEKEKALDALEKSFADGELLIWLKSEPAIDIIRDDPRYRSILAKINLPLTEKAAILAESPLIKMSAGQNGFEQKEIAKNTSLSTLFAKFWYALPIAALAALILYLIINIISHTTYTPNSPLPPTPPQAGGQ
jgi:serine/threonine protein kinase/TolB-like protein/Tfp pilus assembly protein PilF